MTNGPERGRGMRDLSKGSVEAANKALRDEELALLSGDVGRLDDEGNLTILDRKKDVIITGSENVYCSEVEAALYKHPGIHEAAVFGVPDEKWGEAVCAAIVPASGYALRQEEIIEHCRQYIGGYKIPRRMAFVEALPKTALGKVLRTELRRMYGDPDRP